MRRTHGSPLGGIALFLVVLEGAALAVLWAHPPLPPALDQRLGAVEQAAGAAAAKAQGAFDLAHADAGRIDGLSARATAAGAAPGAPGGDGGGNAALADRVAALEARLGAAPGPGAGASAAGATASGGALDGEIASLRTSLDQSREENRQAIASLAASERSDVAGAREASSEADQALSARLGQMSEALDAQRAQTGRIAALASGAQRLARLQAAGLALADGRPIGAIPNAPPALEAFADHSPPTEAALILAFPDAAQATLKASEPRTSGDGFFRRLWVRAQQALTIRDGSRVIVGDPAAGIVAAARDRLAAGDLAGAVAVLDNLTGTAAVAMDPWRSRAASVVDARAALAQMMARAS